MHVLGKGRGSRGTREREERLRGAWGGKKEAKSGARKRPRGPGRRHMVDWVYIRTYISGGMVANRRWEQLSKVLTMGDGRIQPHANLGPSTTPGARPVAAEVALLCGPYF